MPASPTPSVNVSDLRPDIGSFLEYDVEMNRQNFIGYRVLPLFDVTLAGDTIGKIPIEQLLKRSNVRRTAQGGYNRIEWKFTTDTYATEEFGLEGVIDQRNARKYQNYFDAELATARLVHSQVMLEAEIRVANKYFHSDHAHTDVTNEWDDATNATPIDDVEASVRRVHANTGVWPNALVVNHYTFRDLRLCDQITARIAATGAGSPNKAEDITTSMLASVFDLEQVLVAKGDYNTADEGQDASLSQIWDREYAMTCVLPRTNDITEPCLGRTFHWTADGSQQGGTVEQYYSDEVRADISRVRHDVDEKELYAEMADVMGNIYTV